MTRKLDEKLAKDRKKYNDNFSTEILETRDKFGKMIIYFQTANTYLT